MTSNGIQIADIELAIVNALDGDTKTALLDLLDNLQKQSYNYVWDTPESELKQTLRRLLPLIRMIKVISK